MKNSYIFRIHFGEIRIPQKMYTNLHLGYFLVQLQICMTNVKTYQELKNLVVKKLKAPKRDKLRRFGAFSGYIRKRSCIQDYQYWQKLSSIKAYGICKKDIRIEERVRCWYYKINYISNKAD